MSVPAPRNAFPCSSASLCFPLELTVSATRVPHPPIHLLGTGSPIPLHSFLKSLLHCFLGYLPHSGNSTGAGTVAHHRWFLTYQSPVAGLPKATSM